MLASAMAGLSVGSSSAFVAGSPLQQRRPLRAATPVSCPMIEAAHKKGAGSTKNGRDSNSKRRGVKVYGGQPIGAGGIIVRQLGTHFHPGPGVGLGNDYTLYAKEAGIVVFKQTKHHNRVMIVPVEEYVIPEGQRRKEGSRKSLRKQQYQPRSLATVAE